jgi:hypothetical protein
VPLPGLAEATEALLAEDIVLVGARKGKVRVKGKGKGKGKNGKGKKGKKNSNNAQ